MIKNGAIKMDQATVTHFNNSFDYRILYKNEIFFVSSLNCLSSKSKNGLTTEIFELPSGEKFFVIY